MKKMKITSFVVAALIIVSFIISISVYDNLPDKVASHWNAKGEADGYMKKSTSLFLMPVISIALFLLMVFLPMLDPLRKNVKKFRKHYDGFIVGIIAFLFYMHILTIVWNLGFHFDMGQAMAPGLGILFYAIGFLVSKAKRNWFIGIRTPWTLSSDKVWEKTHKLGGKLFKVAGVLAFLGLLLPKFAVWLVLVPVLSFTVYLIYFSYAEFKKEVKK